MLRDLFMRLSLEGLYFPRWSSQIHDEWISNVFLNRPDIPAAKLNRTRHLKDSSSDGSLVDGFEVLIATISLPDPDYRHVLALAIYTNSRLIVSFNLRDFPDYVLREHGKRAVHPDSFLCSIYDSYSVEILDVVNTMQTELRKPVFTRTQLLESFRKQGLNDFANRIEAELRS